MKSWLIDSLFQGEATRKKVFAWACLIIGLALAIFGVLGFGVCFLCRSPLGTIAPKQGVLA